MIASGVFAFIAYRIVAWGTQYTLGCGGGWRETSLSKLSLQASRVLEANET